MASLLLELQRSDTTDQDPSPVRRKRKRVEDGKDGGKSVLSRRRTACQSCRARKVKCDNARPQCAFCRSGGTECIYVDNMADRLAFDPGTKLMVSRLDQILKSIETSNDLIKFVGKKNGTLRGFPSPPGTDKASTSNHVVEPSNDYLRIPSCKTSADTVLTWPIFNDEYPPNCLIGSIFTQTSDRSGSDSSSSKFSTIGRGTSLDVFSISGGLQTMSEEKIPALIERFLRNVHTKNPILDVEALLRYGRSAAEHGLRWDAPSCLVLLACALGSVAYPFTSSLVSSSSMHNGADSGNNAHGSEISSTAFSAGDLQQAESYFVLACCRIALLKPTVIGAQCYFFAGGTLALVCPDPWRIRQDEVC